MWKITLIFCLSFAGISHALPSALPDKLSDGPLAIDVPLATDVNGDNHLEKNNDINEATRYNPDRQNVYHLFTRRNPTVSQPLLINNPGLLQLTNFDSTRRTAILLHGSRGSVNSNFISVVVPAFLESEDMNVIVVDWSAGASSIDFRVVIANTIASGISVANFINWLNDETMSSPVQYHIVGHGAGGHQAGIIGRHVRGNVAYVTGLDPAFLGWPAQPERFQPTDGLYTEVIHTNYGINGFPADLAQVDFYPNGGISMPGCESNDCDHERSFFYFAESLRTGGFTGRLCLNYFAAVLSSCDLLPGRLQMGGLRPKIGSSGVFLLETNSAPPFSRG